MDKQDCLDFITTVCNECVTKGHNLYAGDTCKMSNDDIDYCADLVGYKPKSKFEILEGEVKIYEWDYDESLSIGGVDDFVHWFGEKYGEAGFNRLGVPAQIIKGKFTITVEKLE